MSTISVPRVLEEPEKQKHPLPPLENGDHLDQPTFHERYEAMPENIRVELIGGIVFMASPVGRLESREHGQLITWLGMYNLTTPVAEMLPAPTVILVDDCEPQHDVVLRNLKWQDQDCPAGRREH